MTSQELAKYSSAAGSLGSMFGPIGSIVGAGVGLAGNIGASFLAKKEQEELEREMKRKQLLAAREARYNNDLSILDNFDTKGVGNSDITYMSNGGENERPGGEDPDKYINTYNINPNYPLLQDVPELPKYKGKYENEYSREEWDKLRNTDKKTWNEIHTAYMPDYGERQLFTDNTKYKLSNDAIVDDAIYRTSRDRNNPVKENMIARESKKLSNEFEEWENQLNDRNKVYSELDKYNENERRKRYGVNHRKNINTELIDSLLNVYKSKGFNNKGLTSKEVTENLYNFLENKADSSEAIVRERSNYLGKDYDSSYLSDKDEIEWQEEQKQFEKEELKELERLKQEREQEENKHKMYRDKGIPWTDTEFASGGRIKMPDGGTKINVDRQRAEDLRTFRNNQKILTELFAKKYPDLDVKALLQESQDKKYKNTQLDSIANVYTKKYGNLYLTPEEVKSVIPNHYDLLSRLRAPEQGAINIQGTNIDTAEEPAFGLRSLLEKKGIEEGQPAYAYLMNPISDTRLPNGGLTQISDDTMVANGNNPHNTPGGDIPINEDKDVFIEGGETVVNNEDSQQVFSNRLPTGQFDNPNNFSDMVINLEKVKNNLTKFMNTPKSNLENLKENTVGDKYQKASTERILSGIDNSIAILEDTVKKIFNAQQSINGNVEQPPVNNRVQADGGILSFKRTGEDKIPLLDSLDSKVYMNNRGGDLISQISPLAGKVYMNNRGEDIINPISPLNGTVTTNNPNPIENQKLATMNNQPVEDSTNTLDLSNVANIAKKLGTLVPEMYGLATNKPAIIPATKTKIAPRLKTDFNINQQLGAIKNAADSTITGINRRGNTQTANAVASTVFRDRVNKESELYSQKENVETGLKNESAKANADIYNVNQAEMQDGKLSQIAANAKSKENTMATLNSARDQIAIMNRDSSLKNLSQEAKSIINAAFSGDTGIKERFDKLSEAEKVKLNQSSAGRKLLQMLGLV